LTQADAADLAGCSPRFVRAVESGKSTLRIDKLLDLLEVLGLDLVVVRRAAG
jgi:transcriptional regulator with XRE-family HTH domain